MDGLFESCVNNKKDAFIHRYGWDINENLSMDRFQYAETVIKQQTRLLLIDTQSMLCDIVEKDYKGKQVWMNSLVEKAIAFIVTMILDRPNLENIVFCSGIPGNYDKMADEEWQCPFSKDPLCVFPGIVLDQLDDTKTTYDDFVLGEKIDGHINCAEDALSDDGIRMFVYSVFYHRFVAGMRKEVIKNKEVAVRNFSVIVSVPILRTLTRDVSAVSAFSPNCIRVSKGVANLYVETSSFAYGTREAMLCHALKQYTPFMSRNATEIYTRDREVAIKIGFYMSAAPEVKNVSVFLRDNMIICADLLKVSTEIDGFMKTGVKSKWWYMKNKYNVVLDEGMGYENQDGLLNLNDADFTTYTSKKVYDMNESWYRRSWETDGALPNAEFTAPDDKTLKKRDNAAHNVKLARLIQGMYFYGADFGPTSLFDAHKIAFLRTHRKDLSVVAEVERVMTRARKDAAVFCQGTDKQLLPHPGLCLEYAYAVLAMDLREQQESRAAIWTQWPRFDSRGQITGLDMLLGDDNKRRVCKSEIAEAYGKKQLVKDLSRATFDSRLPNDFETWRPHMEHAWKSVVYWKILHEMYTRPGNGVVLPKMEVLTCHEKKTAAFGTWLMAFYYGAAVNFPTLDFPESNEWRLFQISDAEASIIEFEKEIVDENTRIMKLRNAYLALQAEINPLRDLQKNQPNAARDTEINNLSTQMTTNTKDQATHVGNIKALTQNISKKKADITNLKKITESKALGINEIDNENVISLLTNLNNAIPIVEGMSVSIIGNKITVYFEGWSELDIRCYLIFVMTKVFQTGAALVKDPPGIYINLTTHIKRPVVFTQVTPKELKM
jgi:hypothetical protein